jgi:peroxiredoxin Q/BCP
MVTCERCHRNFVSYAALSQHFECKHHNATKPPELARELAAEKDLEKYRATVSYLHGPSKTKLAAFLLILLVAAGVIGYVALTPRESSGSTIGNGSVAPDFSLPSTSGSTFKLSDYRGKSNVLLFFNEGLSCQPCLTQMQGLDALNSEFKSLNIVVVSITADPVQTLADWTQSSGPRYGMVLSDQGLQVSRMYGMLGSDVSMMPGTAPGHSFVLVNENGMIVWRHDYGPYNMNVPNDEIIAAVKQALGA